MFLISLCAVCHDILILTLSFQTGYMFRLGISMRLNYVRMLYTFVSLMNHLIG
jgi:hypothetical protein